MNKTLLNVAGFQAGWFACVLGAANGMPWLGPFCAAAILGIYLATSKHPRREVAMLLAVALAGSVLDQALLSFALVQYPASAWPSWLLPPWMVTLWLLFASTLDCSLRWLKNRYWVAALFGALGGPLAYLAGAKLGAMQLLDVSLLLPILAVTWGLLTPALLQLPDWLASNHTKRLADV